MTQFTDEQARERWWNLFRESIRASGMYEPDPVIAGRALLTLEAERDEWKGRYEAQCAGSISMAKRVTAAESALASMTAERDAAYERGQLSAMGAHDFALKSLNDEAISLRKQLAEARRERDALRRAIDEHLAYLVGIEADSELETAGLRAALAPETREQ